MYKIIKKTVLTPEIYAMDIYAPRVAKSAQPGQFVIVITDEKGERVPLTICDYDQRRGTVQIVVQAMGKSTKDLFQLEEGFAVKDFVGPLGEPSEFIKMDIEELKDKKVLFVAGGVGSAPVYPQAKWFHDHGLSCDIILGAKNKDLITLEEKLFHVCDHLYVCTDDGSYGFHGMVTHYIDELIENQGKEYDHIVAIGPMIMMKFVALTAEKYGIPITVSLNPIMVDGTGMCGACRVTVGGETKFACVHGPEFDGSKVDFDEALKRQTQYHEEEKQDNYEYREV